MQKKKYDKAIALSEPTSIQMYIASAIDAAINLKNIKTEKAIKKGILILNRAIKKIENPNFNNKILSNRRKITIYKHLGNLHSEHLSINKIEANKNYSKSLKLALKQKDSTSIAQLYNNIGFLNLRLNNKIAINYFNKALDYIKSDYSTKSKVYNNISAFYNNQNNESKALYFINLSINTVLNKDEKYSDLNKTVLKKNKFKLILLDALIEKGSLLNKTSTTTKEKKLSVIFFKLTDYLLDLIRDNSDIENSKLHWQAKASKLYLEAINACYKAKDYESATYFFEKNKAILLLENIEKINFANKNNNALQETNDTNIISLSKIQQNLNKETSLIEYALDNDLGFVLIVSKNQVQIHELKNIEELNHQIIRYSKLISKPISTKEEIILFNTESHKLYKNLFPFKELDILNNKKKLIIVPDHNLQNIPFETLQTNNHYLLNFFNISYAYSYSFLQKNTLKKRNPTKNL